MQNPRELLVLLFALFWASSLAAASRYRGWPTASLMNCREEQEGFWQRVGRLGMSTLLLNLLPVGLLWALWLWAVVPTNEWEALPANATSRRFWGLAGAAFAALSVFSIIRLYHAFVASKRTKEWFYSQDELRRFKKTIQGSRELGHLS